MSNRPVEMIIFDWDGTLIDSSPCVVVAHNRTAESFGMAPHDQSKLETLLGQPSDIVSKVLTEDTGVNAKDYQTCFRDHYTQAAANIDLFPFTKPLLKKLIAQNIRCAIATNKPRAIAEKEIIRTGVTEFFTQIEYASESSAKPDPEMLIRIATNNHVKYENMLMIGDQTNDVDAAINLNMDSIILYDQNLPLWYARYTEKTVFATHTELENTLISNGILEPVQPATAR